MIENGAKVEAMVDAMASYLEKTLTLRDPSLVDQVLENRRAHWKKDSKTISLAMKAAPTLVSALYEERNHLPDRAQLDFLEQLRCVYQRCHLTDKLCSSLLSRCGFVGFGGWEAVEDEVDHEQLEDAGAVLLAPYAREWGYYEYNRLRLGSEHGRGAGRPITVGGLAIELRAQVCGAVVSWLVACDRELCFVHAEHLGNGAVTEPFSWPSDAQLREPPSESDSELVKFVKNAASEIAEKSTLTWGSDSPDFRSGLCGAFCDPNPQVVSLERTTNSSLVMPRPVFAPWMPNWFALRPSGAGLRPAQNPTTESRVVRLSLMLQQMSNAGGQGSGQGGGQGCGLGLVEVGVVHRDLLASVAMLTLQRARHARELINHERMRSQVGCTLLAFEESIQDRCSDLAHDLDVFQCELSKFSLDEILRVFTGKNLERVIGTLTQRTLDRLGDIGNGNVLPIGYLKFARDGLATLLPAIAQRRNTIDRSILEPPSILGDLLRSSKFLRNWNPLDGAAKIGSSELSMSHPNLRRKLEELSISNKNFVKTKGKRAHRKVEFTFDSRLLVQILRL